MAAKLVKLPYFALLVLPCLLVIPVSAIPSKKIDSLKLIKQGLIYIGLLTVFPPEENAFLGTGDFKPNPEHPFVDLSGRLFRVRMVQGKNVIYVGCGFGMVKPSVADMANGIRALSWSFHDCSQCSGEINSMQNAYKKGLLASSVRAAKESKVKHGLKQAKDVVKGIKRKLGSRNSKVQLLALTLLETIIKNCGDIVHMHVAEKDLLHEMVKIAKKKPDFHVKEKILVLVDTWQGAFGGARARYPQYYVAYQEFF
uniref:VHS domain-containing protein n=1 Tax=Salix viminalis TaxID=40686 RepID=A0A6N2N1D1_SALVM